MKKFKIAAFIPARMGASRFPGKPLVSIMGLPMIEHVRRRTTLSSQVDEVYVATCDEEIMAAVEKHGGKAIMTAKTHERCTDRIEEACRNVEADLIVIVQGDEPLLLPEQIDVLINPFLENDNLLCTNLISILENEEEINNIDNVKVVLDSKGYVLYYSRSPIPFRRHLNISPFYRQTGLSVFKKSFLRLFSQLPPTPLEITESVDFQRIIEHRYPILGVPSPLPLMGVDRPEDVGKIESVLQTQPEQNFILRKILGEGHAK